MGHGGKRSAAALIRIEFIVGATGCTALGVLSLVSGTGWVDVLGVWLLGAGINYIPLALQAQSLSRPGALGPSFTVSISGTNSVEQVCGRFTSTDRFIISGGGKDVTEKRRTTSEEARRVGDAIGVDWSRFELEQCRAGMDVEFEHGSHDPQTDVTHDDPILTGKIALAHMKEFPDYYERLERMESEAERDWAGRLS